MLPRYFFIIVIYLFFFWFQFTIIFPIETNFNEFAGIVSLIYLPHAVRIISFFIIGSVAFIPIYIAEFLCHIIFVNQILTDALIRPFLSCMSVFIIFQALKYFNFNLSMYDKKYFNWKVILFVVFCSSLLNSIFNFIYHVNFKNVAIDTSIIYSYVIGDTLGVFFGMLMITLLIKLYAKFFLVNKY